MKPSIIMCRFDPAGYSLPRKHFLDSVSALSGLGIDLVVVQAVLPGQSPEAMPGSVKSIVLPVETVLFRKENLWNIGANRASGDVLIFLDTDVFFESPSWVNDTCEALNNCDVLQPFDECVWLDSKGAAMRKREAVSNALSANTTPNLATYHPGFGWAMTRAAYDKIGGFYDTCVSGSGDSAFTFGFTSDELLGPMLPWWRQHDRFFLAPSYDAWRRRTLALGLKVGRCHGVRLIHRWHGTMSGRRYVERDAMFPRDESGEYPLIRRKDGVLEWASKAGDEACREYFCSRAEDGRPPWLFGIGTAKSGTNSLNKALGIIGIESRHCGGDVESGNTDVVDTIFKNKSSGKALLDGIRDIDALIDWPIHELYRDLAEQYRDSKFILTYRPPEDIALSWIRMVQYSGLDKDGSSWPSYTRTYAGFRDYAERHISGVLEYFSHQPDRLLILDCRDPDEHIWKELCNFTDRPKRKVVAKYPSAFSHTAYGRRRGAENSAASI